MVLSKISVQRLYSLSIPQNPIPMILFRYLSREVFTAMAIIAFVVFVIASGSRLSRYLSDAATGALSGELIGWLLLYRLRGS